MRPALSPEARDLQLASLATDLAEQQLRDGTARTQVIVHYLKLGAEREKARLELEILEKQRDLMEAKTQSLQAQKRTEELISNALAAMRRYSGQTDEEDDSDIFDAEPDSYI